MDAEGRWLKPVDKSLGSSGSVIERAADDGRQVLSERRWVNGGSYASGLRHRRGSVELTDVSVRAEVWCKGMKIILADSVAMHGDLAQHTGERCESVASDPEHGERRGDRIWATPHAGISEGAAR